MLTVENIEPVMAFYVDVLGFGLSDYITKPFAPAMVRTRVRSWLLRSEAGRCRAAADPTVDGSGT